jgi:hypothetical protein
MSVGETARTNYQSVRSEILERIQLRDNVLVMYLGAIGAFFGLSLGTQAKPEILLIIPYFALGATVIITQHHSMIGSLGDFLAREMEPFLKKIGEYAPQWDTSNAIRDSSHRLSWRGLTVGYILLIDVPAAAALFLNRGSIDLPLPESLLWWSGVALTILSVLAILETRWWRRKLNRYLDDKAEAESKAQPEALSQR